MKFRLFLIVFILIVGNSAFAQKSKIEFMHALGGSYAEGIADEGSYGGVPMITYAPRVNYIMSREMSVSLTANIGLGFSIEGNTATGTRNKSFGYELPISVDFNFGHAATKRSRTFLGGFVGAGYGFNSMEYKVQTETIYTTWTTESKGKTHGAYFNAGVRFEYKDTSYSGAVYTILGSNDITLIGIRGFMNFGM